MIDEEYEEYDQRNYIQCMKHGKGWSNRVQWILNKLRNKVIPQKHHRTFHKILCTCKLYFDDFHNSHGLEDLWESVPTDELKATVAFMDNYISSNKAGDVTVSVVTEVMKCMRKDEIEQDPPFEESLYDGKIIGPRSGAYRLLYLLQKCIEGDFTMLHPKKRLHDMFEAPSKIQQSLTFDLEGFTPDKLNHLIGCAGRSIVPFQKEHKCRVVFEKVGEGDEEKVRATVSRTTAQDEKEELEKIKTELQSLAMVIEDDEKNYQERKEAELEQQKKEFSDLVVDLSQMGPDAEWQVIHEHLEEHVIMYDTLDLDMVDVEIQEQWFNDIKENLEQLRKERKERLAEEEALRASVVTTTSVASTLTATNTATTESAVDVATAAIGNLSISDTSPASGAASSTSTVTPSQPTLAPLSISVGAASAPPKIMSSTPPAEDMCLVHDRRWMATFQFTINQMYNHIKLPRKEGRTFSRLVCTCDPPKTDPDKFYPGYSDLRISFDRVTNAIEKWPAECQGIMAPLLNLLKKAMKRDVVHSLCKFGFYFDKCSQGEWDCLKAEYKLPGTVSAASSASTSPQSGGCSAPGCTICQRSAARSSGIASSLYTSALSGNTSSYTPRSSLLAKSKQSSITIPPGAKLKKVDPADWREDCYFHGKKLKFVFQCVVNYLHKHASLPTKYNLPFSMACCSCDETIELKEFYPDNSEKSADEDLSFMGIKLVCWRGDSKMSVQPLIKTIEGRRENKTYDGGFLKFAFYFKKVYDKDLAKFEEIHELMKRARL